jgi:2,4-dienoyl-CoA reductase-like NADH-dependent reductase (Old Yellow Enzyme family)
MSATLLTPLSLHSVRFAHRMWVAPRATHAAKYGDGTPTDAHLVHYGAFAQGGFALILTEPTAINPGGRESLTDVGLWSDIQVPNWRRISEFVHSARLKSDSTTTPVRLGILLSHAGRKTSLGQFAVGPSTVPMAGNLHAPTELDQRSIAGLIADFAAAAKRAKRAEFDVISINVADGTLLHQFISPLTNKRTDVYGGRYGNRVRVVRDVVDAVRQVWDGPLFVRIPATDWALGGWDTNDATSLAVLLGSDGADLIDVSSGGNSLAEENVRPGYRLEFTSQIKRLAGGVFATSGALGDPVLVKNAIAAGKTDAVMLGATAQAQPHWPQIAALALGYLPSSIPYPV